MSYYRVFLLGFSLFLGSCGYQPLYGTATSGVQVASQLESVSVEQQKTRTGQLVRNEILSSIGAGRVGTDTRYQLKFSTSSNKKNTARSFNTDTTRKSFRLSVSFTLSDTSGGKIVLKGQTFADISFDETVAAFSDYQAKINAEEKAAKQVGSDIHTRLAVYFASN